MYYGQCPNPECEDSDVELVYEKNKGEQNIYTLYCNNCETKFVEYWKLIDVEVISNLETEEEE